MKKRLLLPALLFSAVVTAQTVHPDYQDGKIWFKVKDNYNTATLTQNHPYDLPVASLPFLANMHAYELTALSRPFHAAKNSNTLQRTYLLEFADYAHVDDIIASLKQSGAVDYAERVPLDRPTLTPNDPSYSSQWHLATIGASTAWNFYSTGSNVAIAIVDDAVQRNHPDLSPNVWVNPGEIPNNNIDDDGNGYIDDINGYDVASNDNNPDPPSTSYSHGTHVAGISSAATNNNAGIASIGFSCKLMCVKSTNSSSVISNGYDGIVYAASSGARIINCSWGGTGSSTTAQNVITWAWNQGCIIIAAAGNNNVNTQFYPAAYTNVYSVAATNSTDAKASFSNYGTWVDISAPGNNIYSTYPTSTYSTMSGTSMASPLVAGLAGLMASLNPTMPNSAILNCITSTATNINAQNPSYIGQLGAGRINAASAMNCVSQTLTLPPVAAFTANVTTVTAGGNVYFTDQSTYNPTSWSWSFPGGTPASFNGQTPPAIVYNTPGTYNVSLTVTNGNGSDVQTNTNYITVTAASGCLTMNLPAPGTWTPVNYYTGSTVGQDGWINGMNVYLDREKAMYFDASSSPYTQLVNVWVAFGRAYSANPNKIVPMRIYDGSSGTPGAQIGSTVNATMGSIMQDVAGNYYTEYSFVNTPVTLPVSKRFFVSIDLTNLQWTTGVKDTLSIVSNTAGQTTPSAIWERQSNNTWYQYTTSGSWNLSASLYIHPFLTNANTVATFTQSATTVCQGSSITFNATGSTYEDTLLWYFPSGTPLTSNNLVETTIYNTPGNYQAILYIVGGGCSLFDSAFVNITVNANPTVAITATPQTTICPGNTVNLLASGATSYVWSPPTGLSSTTTAATVASPTATITYNVQGTASNGCQNNSTITIDVDNPPVAVATPASTNICIGQAIVIDGSASTNANNFSWSFPGGTPSTSTAPSPSVTWNTAGTYTATLIASNSCGSDTVQTVQINVGCTGIGELNTANLVTTLYSEDAAQLEVNLQQMQAGEKYVVRIMDLTGKLIATREVMTANGRARVLLPMHEAAAGAYIIAVTGEGFRFNDRFVKTK